VSFVGWPNPGAGTVTAANWQHTITCSGCLSTLCVYFLDFAAERPCYTLNIARWRRP
jgi:uncharacterized protein (DUF697 family)